MTKVQRTFKLSRELNDEELKKISHIHAVYGILAARLVRSGELFVEYDASRLSPKEVEGTLEENGIPLAG
jgi:uncharacterized membrane protein